MHSRGLSLASLALLACTGAVTNSASGQGIVVDVQPESADVVRGGTVRFAAAVSGSPDIAVLWSVVEVGGGSIDSSGLYTAPVAIGQYHVSASSHADPSVQDLATVNVTAAIPPPGPGIACGIAPLRSTGRIYYYCDCQAGSASGCVPGNDANLGTSPSSPRRTLPDAVNRFNGMNSGDTVALCRTGSWSEGGSVFGNPNCRATNDSTYCDFRDYTPSWGNSTSALPRISVPTDNIFHVYNGSNQGLRFWNLDLRSNDPASTAANIQVFGDQRNIDFCGLNVQGGAVHIQTDENNSYVSIRNSTFKYAGIISIMASTHYFTVDGNTFIDNGDQNTPGVGQSQAHVIYMGCGLPATPCPGVVIKNNYFRNDPNGSWPVPGGGFCNSIMVDLRGMEPGVLVENNLWEGTNPDNGNDHFCAPFALSGSYAYTEIHDAVIRRNRVIQTVNPITKAFQIDACVNCTVEDNIFDLVAGDAIQSPNTASYESEPCNGSPPCAHTFAVTTGTIIRNNTIRTGAGVGIDVHKEGQDFIVENNVVYVPNGQSCFNVTRPTAAGHPFTVTNYPSTALNAAGNYCVNDGTSPSVLWVDAENANPAARNYKPVNPGPLIGTGNQSSYSAMAVGSVTWTPDDPGVARTPPVDIGAFQR